MKGAGLQFRSAMPSTAQLVCGLWTHADEFIHIYSLSGNFQAKQPDCSVYQPKQDPYMPAGVRGSAVRRGSELYWGEVIAMLKKPGQIKDCWARERLRQAGDFCGAAVK